MPDTVTSSIAPDGYLNQICMIVARLTDAPVVLVGKVDEVNCHIVGRYGCDIETYSARHCQSVGKRTNFSRINIQNPAQHRNFRRHPLTLHYPRMSVLSVIPFPLPQPFNFGCLILVDPNFERGAETSNAAILSDLAKLCQSIIMAANRQQQEKELNERMEASYVHSLKSDIAEAPDGVAIFDAQMNVVSANKIILDLLNLKLGDALGRKLSELSPISPDEIERMGQMVIKSGRPTINKIMHNKLGVAYGVFFLPVCTRPRPTYFAIVVQRRRRLDKVPAEVTPAKLPRKTKLLQQDRQSMPGGFAEAPPRWEVGSKFLLDTLVNKQKLHHRNHVSFVSVRSWRQPIKEYQISALTSLKEVAPAFLAEIIAGEIVDCARRLFGADGLKMVVPVPCGSSGRKDCLSVQLARRVADHLGLQFAEVLEPIGAIPGKSHPKKSAQLQRFKLTGKVAGPILLVDDVATSGRHMELAISSLKRRGLPVVGLTWIG